MSDTRRTWLLVLLVSMLVISGPASTVVIAEHSGDPSPFQETVSEPLADGDFSDVVRFDGNPSVFVYYKDGKLESLQTWAEGNPDRDIISTRNDSNRALVAAPVDDLGLSFVTRHTGFGGGLATRDYVDHMAANRQVELVEPINALATSDEHTPPEFSGLVAAASLDATSDGFSGDGLAYREDTTQSDMSEVRSAVDASGNTYTGEGVRIAILDTGLNAENLTSDPLFEDRIEAPKNEITNETGLDAVSDGNGHGSWVAGAAAADPQPSVVGESHEGVAPNATVIPVKVLSDEGTGNTGNIVAGIDHARDNNADIISMSLGSVTYSPAIAEALREFLDDGGTAVIVAAGNSKMSPTAPATRYISSPADVPGVIGVQATNTNGSDEAKVSYFGEVGPDNGVDGSNGVTVGETPEVAAPGMNVTAARLTQNGIRENATLSGTSMATPVIAGVAARMLEAQPQLENESDPFRRYLMNTSSRMPHAGITETQSGMVSAANATSLTVTEEDQSDVRTDKAVARDAANEAYSQSRLVKTILDLSSQLQTVATIPLPAFSPASASTSTTVVGGTA